MLYFDMRLRAISLKFYFPEKRFYYFYLLARVMLMIKGFEEGLEGGVFSY